MSDFLRIVNLIGELVEWVIRKTLDFLCFLMLVFSCVLPWRFLEVSNSLSWDENKWRSDAVKHFLLTLVDFICVPLSLFSFASIFRWRNINWAFVKYFNNNMRIKGMYKLRIHLFAVFLLSILDCYTFPFVGLAMLSPIRVPSMIRLVLKSKPFQRWNLELDGTQGQFRSDLYFNMKIIAMGFGAVLDLFTYPFAIFGVASPLRTYQYRLAVYSILQEPDYAEKYEINVLSILHGLGGILDLILVPFAFLALASPIRSRTVCQRLHAIIYAPVSNRKIFDVNIAMIVMGLIAVVDFLTFPCAIVAILSLTRAVLVIAETIAVISQTQSPPLQPTTASVYEFPIAAVDPNSITSTTTSSEQVNAVEVVAAETYNEVMGYLTLHIGDELMINLTWVVNGIGGLIDDVCIIVGTLCAVLMPSNMYSLVSGTQEVLHRHLPSTAALNACEDSVSRQTMWDILFFELRLHMLWFIPYMFFDAAAVVFGIIALLSPLRHIAIRGVILREWGGEEFEIVPPADEAVTADATTNATPSSDPDSFLGDVSRDKSEEHGGEHLTRDTSLTTSASAAAAAAPIISTAVTMPTSDGSGSDTRRDQLASQQVARRSDNVRWQCIYFGCMALVDGLMLPFLLPLWVTWYR